ncbi:hypothetical protein ACTG16_23270 [Aeromonas sp. 23P]|uniref:hypothetical protein n=1 Tax=Aeromonas sp. 23P TaxID=3452716 RepID=UPI003F7A1EE1
MQHGVTLKSIGDKEFEFKAEPVTRDQIVGMVILAIVAVFLFVFFKSLGMELSIIDAMTFLLIIPVLVLLRQVTISGKRQANYFKYLETIPMETIKAADASLDDESRVAVKKFIERQAATT